MASTGEFPQFSRLPKELQIKIFKLSLQPPHVKSRIVRRMHTPVDYHLTSSTTTYKFTIPAALQVSSLYRSIALPCYPSLVPGTLYPVYFNPNVDFVSDFLKPAKNLNRPRKKKPESPPRARTPWRR